MPNYTVTDPASGKTVTLTGDSPPTEQELEQIFSSVSSSAPEVRKNPKTGLPMEPFSPGLEKGLLSVAAAAPAIAGSMLAVPAATALGAGALGTAATVGLEGAGASLGEAALKGGEAIYNKATGQEQPPLKNTAWDILKPGLGTAAVGAVTKGIGAFIDYMKPSMVRLGAQLIKSTSGVPEKFGVAVLNNPDILTKAETMDAAQKTYQAAVKGLPGARDFLEQKTGDLLMGPGDATKIVNDAFAKVGTAELTLPEALAARQSTSFLLQAAKFGNPEQRANLSQLIKAKTAFDDYLEEGLPGFKSASKGYFESNAREAFDSILPQNKNLSPNVLRSLGALSSVSAGALLHAPFMMAAALPASPAATGLGIRAASAASHIIASQSAQFLARVAAINAARSK